MGVEIRPISHAFAVLQVNDSVIRSDWLYFTGEAQRFDEEGTCAGWGRRWTKRIHTNGLTPGAIVTALADAGFRIDDLREHPVADFEQFPGTMRRWEDGKWVVPGEDYPVTFSLGAHVPAEDAAGDGP